jgi:hypothetical protein
MGNCPQCHIDLPLSGVCQNIHCDVSPLFQRYLECCICESPLTEQEWCSNSNCELSYDYYTGVKDDVEKYIP